MTLSERQQAVLGVIRQADGKPCPTNKAIGAALGYTHIGRIPIWLRELREAGAIKVITQFQRRRIIIVGEGISTAKTTVPPRKKKKKSTVSVPPTPLPVSNRAALFDAGLIEGVTLADTAKNDCRYPYNDDKRNLICCGEPIAEESPYCAEHHNLTHVPYERKKGRMDGEFALFRRPGAA